MAITAIASGCDSLATWSTEGQNIAATTYAGTNQNNSTGPPAGTKMSFVGHYLSRGLTGAVISNLLANNVAVIFIWEYQSSVSPFYDATDPGYFTAAQGARDGQLALSAINSLGSSIPTNRPIYFAVDYDASGDLFPVEDYFAGINSILSIGRIGAYGGGTMLQQLSNNKLASYFWQSRSSGYGGNSDLLSITHMWQWPPGYSPSGDVTVSGHGVDGDFAYKEDFGQYPYTGSNPPPPNPPVAPATPTNITGVTTVPTYDKVIFSTTTSGTVSNTISQGGNSATTQTLTTVSTDVNQLAYPVGIYSYDGGDTWNDFGQAPKVAANILPYAHGNNVTVWAVAEANSIIFKAIVWAVQAGVGDTLTIDVKVALLATADPSPVPSLALSQGMSYSSALASSNYATYRKIYAEEGSNQVGTVGQLQTIIHGVGEIPSFLYWDVQSTYVQAPAVYLSLNPTSGSGSGYGLFVDDKNIYYYSNAGVTGKWNFRLYKENT